MVEQVSDSKDVCNFQVNTLFKVPGVWKFSDAHLICKALVGNANLISSSENQNKIRDCEYSLNISRFLKPYSIL